MQVPLTDRNQQGEIPQMESMISVESDAPAEARVGKKFSWRLLLRYVGPGWLMSIAYLDPGNLESDLQAGAYTGYTLMWVLWWSTCLGLFVQVLSARLSCVTGDTLAVMCRKQYPSWCSKCLWVLIELAIIGSDIQEVLGSALAFKVLFGWQLWVGCLVTGFDTFTFLCFQVFGVRKLEAFFAMLVATMVGCFLTTYIEANVPFGEVAKGWVVPEVPSYGIETAVGIVGAVIMPHNLFLHSALVLSRPMDRNCQARVTEACYYNAIESAIALLVSFVINLAVVSVFAKGFFDPTCAEQGLAMLDGVCQPIGLEEAGHAMESFLGSSSKYVWAIGLLAAGQSATMTGTVAGQYVMEGFLDLRLPMWQRLAVTRSLALGPAVLVAINTQYPSTFADQMDEWLNVLQSMVLPFAVLPLLKFTSDPRLMGAFANGPKRQVLLWTSGLGVVGINVYTAATTDGIQALAASLGGALVLAVAAALYLGLVLYLVGDDLRAAVGVLRCLGAQR